MSDCPLTLHYQTPTQLIDSYVKRDGESGDVCIPVAKSQLKRNEPHLHAECDCYGRKAASDLAFERRHTPM